MVTLEMRGSRDETQYTEEKERKTKKNQQIQNEDKPEWGKI